MSDDHENQYHYTPTLWIGILFLVLFSISGILHILEALYTRLWFLLPTVVLANIGEIIGWSGRVWSSQNVFANTPFLIQICSTIIAPTPLLAANFVILGEVIRRLGQKYSRLSAKAYTFVFLACDIIALIVQAAGGGVASSADTDGKDPSSGGHIMLGGIVFQLVAISVYMLLATEFVLRYLKDRPVRPALVAAVGPRTLDTRMRLMLFGLGLSTLAIFIRSIYRVVELADGWDGRVISTERYFDWLDGGMITLATFTVNIFHPGLLLGRGNRWFGKHIDASGTSSRSGTFAEDATVVEPKRDNGPGAKV
ncbi:RTA1 domain-containing protein [Phanerochaete sordida]|uniref:RTA1 domain-containing protein n=1 Tax=Phanerochaete sordida TaxID=48140 RepID=A0A9P3LLP1_9APHY|nr:RTA1 domain-containing protein [Phanerochaete sordida]